MRCFFILTLITLFVSCNNSSNNSEAVTPPPKPLVPSLPTLKLVDASGQTIDLGALKGKKVFVNLWATWCPPCRAEMPSIKKLASAVDSNKVSFVMLSLDEDFEAARQFAKQTNLGLPIYAAAGSLPTLFQTQGIPVTYIFNESGELIFRRDRAENYDQPQFVEMLQK
ncbi:MAG: TlpA family protein disulfide reductase [Chitinophagaceae bacterium]